VALPRIAAGASLYKTSIHYRLMGALVKSRAVELQQQLPRCDNNCLNSCLLRCLDFDNACRTECHFRCCRPPPQPPQINLSYQGGNPGTLTVRGQNFAPDSDITLTICNCDLNASRAIAHTSQNQFVCFKDHCFPIPGGSFTTTVACFCGPGGTGIACGGPPVINQSIVMVNAQDGNGNTLANGTTANPC
jgi:hypothetical protein